MSISKTLVKPLVRKNNNIINRPLTGFNIDTALQPVVHYKQNLYQDTAGTTPIRTPGTGGTDAEYAVGLQMDEAQGLELGPELWPTSGYTLGSGWSFAGGVFTATSVANAIYAGVPSTPYTTGTFYLATYECFDHVAGNHGLITKSSGKTGNTGNGVFTEIVQAGVTANSGLRASGTLTAKFRNISVREIKGYHATQSTSTARPTYSARYNRYVNTMFNGGGVGSFPTSWVGTGPSGNGVCAGVEAAIVNGISTRSVKIRRLGTNQVEGFQSTLSTTFPTGSVVKCSVWVRRPAGVVAASLHSYMTPGGFIKVVDAAIIAAQVDDVWYNYTFTRPALVSDGTFHSFTTSEIGNVGRGFDIALPDIRLESDFDQPPYQWVTDALTYDTAGFKPYLRYDLTDDVLPNGATYPAISGQIWIATRKGLWIDSFDFAGGSFSFGPTTYTGGPTGLLSVIGGDVIDWGISPDVMTDSEIARLTRDMRSRGCPGLIVREATTLTNGTFDSDTIWTKGGGWAISGGVATATATGSTNELTQFPGFVEGGIYITSFSATRSVGTLTCQLGGPGASTLVVSSSGAFVFVGIAAGLSTNSRIRFIGNASFSGTLDNVTTERLIFP